MAFFPANFIPQVPQKDEHPPLSTLSSILPPRGVASFLGKRSTWFSGNEMGEEANSGEDDLSEEAGEKKRRLNMEQVKTLEKNFELGNKLEPERKMQLARALNLQPRQIAIWFQNRRARGKTKQLEKDYDLLKRHLDAIKADNEALQTLNQKLQAEILAIQSREPAESIHMNKETEGSGSNRSENSSHVKLDISSTPAPQGRRPFFPIPAAIRAPGVAHLFQMGKEESLSNMFCGVYDQSGELWPGGLENQRFN